MLLSAPFFLSCFYHRIKYQSILLMKKYLFILIFSCATIPMFAQISGNAVPTVHFADANGRILPAGAAADLNTLRDARINGYSAASFASKGDLITAIMNERFKELPFEGHRFFDAKRRNLPIIRLAGDAQNNKITLESGNFRFLLPIPNSEIQANPLMVQNPGYSN